MNIREDLFLPKLLKRKRPIGNVREDLQFLSFRDILKKDKNFKEYCEKMGWNKRGRRAKK